MKIPRKPVFLSFVVACLLLIPNCSSKSPSEGRGGKGSGGRGGAAGEKSNLRPIVETVRRVNLKDAISNTGTLDAVVRVEIKSEASGRVDTVWVDEGANLKKGDIILEIDPERLLTRKERLTLNVRKARLKYNMAVRDYENAQKLAEYGKVSAKSLEDLQNNRELAQIEMDNLNLEMRDIQKELDNTIIRAHMNGVLVELTVEEGEIVVSATSGTSSGGTSIGKIADIAKLEVETDISEVDYPKVHIGMNVDISMASDPTRTTTGKVTFLSLSAKKENNSSVANFKVRISLDSLLQGMVPGVNVNLDMVLVEKEGVLGVPYSMVQQRKRDDRIEYSVTIADEKKPRRIEVGITDFKYYEVLSGLKEGEKVTKTPEGDKFMRRH